MTARRTLTAALALTLTLAAPAVPALASTAPEPDPVVEQLEELLPADTPRLDALYESGGIDPAEQAEQLERLVEGSAAECSPTGLQQWLQSQTTDWTPADVELLGTWDVLNWPYVEALLRQPAGPQTFGVDGEHTQELHKTFRTLKSFWDVEGEDIQLAAMHGSAIFDDARMVPVVSFAYQVPRPLAQQVVDLVQEHLRAERFDGGDHPMFSFNAVAYSDGDGPDSGIPDKIIVGDGVLMGMEAVGLGDVAPRGILAHEYGHHVQYELDLMDGYGSSSAVTRLLELEADGLAGYYLSHPRGERLRQQRVEAFVRSFGETGDCDVTGNGHHGTPAQRVAAARWGDELANAKGKKGHILPAETVSDRFRDALPGILAPSRR